MGIAERIIGAQKKNLSELNNKRFTRGNMEYRLSYDGGIAEFVTIQGRRCGTDDFRYINGFNGYMFTTTAEALAHAKKLVNA